LLQTNNLMEDKREVWQRGPLENIPPLLQPVAHALLQAREELFDIMNSFPERLLWERPSGVASPAFHLQHLTGVLNRLFTYARKEHLSSEQLYALSIEGNQQETSSSMMELIELFDKQVDLSINELSSVNFDMLTEARTICTCRGTYHAPHRAIISNRESAERLSSCIQIFLRQLLQ
jgi:hypothetical protein